MGRFETEGYFYAIWLIGNTILHNKIEHLMTRSVGCPPKKSIVLYHSFRYQAACWDIPRRGDTKIEWYPYAAKQVDV